MPRLPFATLAPHLSILLSILVLFSLLLALQTPQRVQAQPTIPRGFEPTQVDAIQIIDDVYAGELHVPISTTLVFSDTFLNEGYIIGPGPGVWIIDDVTIDGHLVISDGADNYGPIYVNGQLSTHGAWYDYGEYRYVCDPIRDICVESSIHGHVTNRGLWHSNGFASMPNGVTNEGHWRNSAAIETDGIVANSGWMTNTGQIAVTHGLWNRGVSANPGLLVNSGTIYNWGTLTGRIDNRGAIYSMGILSATVEGEGSVHRLNQQIYFPFIRVATFALQ